MASEITPLVLLNAYSRGIFPMAESRASNEIFWLDPKQRGIMPLDGFHISRSLRRTLLREPYEIRVNTAFKQVVEGCADRDETWINDTILGLYLDLFDVGHAHSVEVWEGDALVGGIYGVSLRGAFFGESMFSRKRDTSKIAIAYLISRLKFGGFALFDTQFMTDHLASLGGVEIPREQYHAKLKDALSGAANFLRQPQPVSGRQVCNE